MSERIRSSRIRAAFAQISLCGMLSMLPMIAFSTARVEAQLAGKGSITGVVTDPTGAVVPKATITALNPVTGFSVTQTSASAGEFTISPLDPGVYTVTVKAQGFETQQQGDVHVNALEVFSYSPKLTVGGSDQTVSVSSAPPALETSNATLGATMESEMYEALPIEMGAYGQPDQRRATDFAFLMPGVQGNNTSGNPTTNTGIVNGSGSRGGVSVVYIDGTPFVRAGGNGDPRFVWTAISVDAVDQFQVQTSGYSAIYEGQGIQNYTIKQGGKQYHGSIYEFFRNTALDTYGFYGKIPNAATGLVHKPVEHSNEFGINLSGPLVPFGRFKDRLFAFGNYNGFRYANETPTLMTYPTLAQQKGNFQGVLTETPSVQYPDPLTNPNIGVFDPNTQATCTSHSTMGPCRYRYGFGYSGTPSANGGSTLLCPTAPSSCADIIPSSQFSAVALKLQSYLPALSNQGVQNNYIGPNKSGLVNFSTTERVDYMISPKNTLTLLGAVGRQASSNPVGQSTAGRNIGPVPYNYGQAYAPKTVVGVIEDTHVITNNLVNQFKYGYARYNGPTFDSDQTPAYAASAQGITGQPLGPAQSAFPIVSFAGTNAPTQWAGTAPNITLAENFTLLDNLQWVKGKHTFTFGGQIAWMLYNVVSATGNSTPITLSNAVTETSGITPSTNAAPKYAAISGTGLSYASFLIGQIDKTSFTQYLQQELGTRFRPVSPYFQDNWKVTQNLTLDLGVRYDFFPTLREVHDAQSFFNPTLTNPITGAPGALQFAGNGAGTCNCDTPVKNYYKNIGPRLGLAYQIDPTTVIRASYGVMFTHGNAVGGSATSLGTLGYSSAPSFAASGTLLSTAPFTGPNGALPAYTVATGVASGPSYGTGYTTVAGFTGTPSGMGYADPYLGSRAPEYINWTFGMQHVFAQAFTFTATYVGSQGHFLPADGSNARGFFADQLDPKYLSLGSNLSLTGAALQTFCAANAGICPSTTNLFTSSQSLATLLKPFPFQSVSDTFGYVANSNYNAVQISGNMRASHGLTFMANYTWSRSIDDGGTFRSGYAIPAAYSNNGQAYAQDRIERSASTSNQPHHVVLTGVWALPFGKTIANQHGWERAVLGGYRFSEIFQGFSGSPLAITGATCQTNPAESTCNPTINPNFIASGRINGKWGTGALANQTTSTSPMFLNANAFVPIATLATSQYAYTFGNAPRTAPFGMTGPGNINLDLALVRSFAIHGLGESTKLDFRAEWYNVTNHTFFAVASTQFGNAAFGQVTNNTAATRKSAQFSARLNF